MTEEELDTNPEKGVIGNSEESLEHYQFNRFLRSPHSDDYVDGLDYNEEYDFERMDNEAILRHSTKKKSKKKDKTSKISKRSPLILRTLGNSLNILIHNIYISVIKRATIYIFGRSFF